MQGFAIKHNIPYVYRTAVKIPADFENKIITLRFESVYSYARVWVNGKFIRDHKGGFTPWECDLTNVIAPGEIALIAVEFTDRDDDLSYASGYAKHQIGGILRNVTLRALPDNFPAAVRIHTRFDRKYRDAELKIEITRGINSEAWVGFRMYDRNGNQVRLNDRRYRLRNDTSEFSFDVRNPFQWDAENPNLYTLIVEVFNKSILTASYKTSFGFREVKTEGNRLLVNGRPVKLRGACRHDIHPLLGRVATDEYDEMDVLLAKEANINFIRTSHYPPSEAFLRNCDKYGIYVEDESAVCFVNTHRKRFYKDIRQNGIEFYDQQLSQIEEMVQNHINHPSVIIWSLGNESLYNEGFRLGYEYIKKNDPTRPVIYSYPGSVPDSVKCYDLLSMHYPSWSGDLEQWGIKTKGFNYYGMPVIFDEWAHVACYNKTELLEDMNVRNFWGQSLDSMWTNLFLSEGTGGAIWGLIDETFMLPDTMGGSNIWWGIQEENNGVKMYEGPAIGYGEWGIVDTWRRKKPEFWNTKKAYSPVRIPVSEIPWFKAWAPLRIPVQNRFSHTNLKDIKAVWTFRGKSFPENLKNIGPGENGEISLTPRDWKLGEVINIKFLKDKDLIDEYNLRLGNRKPEVVPVSIGEVSYSDSLQGIITIKSGEASINFNRKTGYLEDINIRGDTLIKSGPFLHLRYYGVDQPSALPTGRTRGDFRLKKVDNSIEKGAIKLNVAGVAGKIDLSYTVTVLPGGVMEIAWSATGFDNKLKPEELGIGFKLGKKFESVKWDRKSYWSAYPPDHIGSGQGEAGLNDFTLNRYRTKPIRPWEFDNKSFYYSGFKASVGLSWLASSLKENIYSYSLSTIDDNELTIVDPY
jgi:hypothetical protein